MTEGGLDGNSDAFGTFIERYRALIWVITQTDRFVPKRSVFASFVSRISSLTMTEGILNYELDSRLRGNDSVVQ